VNYLGSKINVGVAKENLAAPTFFNKERRA
jgi:hypothetical protein